VQSHAILDREVRLDDVRLGPAFKEGGPVQAAAEELAFRD
jgi:hypothetical protein